VKVKRGYHGAIAPLKVEIGRTYNFLTVVKPLRKEKRVGTIYECLCECGNVTEANATQLVRGNKKSCGCFARKVSRENMIAVHESKGRKIHDMHGTRLHNLWRAMISRCTYVGDTNYHHYGGRGITVCDSWRDFITFKDWALSHGYSDELSIDRIDVNGNYEPKNCQWIPFSKQYRNKRTTHWIEVNGENKTITEWANMIGISHSAIIQAKKRGRDVSEYIAERLP
jgi:hypothetical protein